MGGSGYRAFSQAGLSCISAPETRRIPVNEYVLGQNSQIRAQRLLKACLNDMTQKKGSGATDDQSITSDLASWGTPNKPLFLFRNVRPPSLIVPSIVYFFLLQRLTVLGVLYYGKFFAGSNAGENKGAKLGKKVGQQKDKQILANIRKSFS